MNGITEIVGPSGVGKTQLCLQLSLTSQLPEEFGGLNKGFMKLELRHKSYIVIAGAVYICTEDAFPSKRLTELTEKLPQRFKNCKLDGIKFNDNIFVEHLEDFVTDETSTKRFAVC